MVRILRCWADETHLVQHTAELKRNTACLNAKVLEAQTRVVAELIDIRSNHAGMVKRRLDDFHSTAESSLLTLVFGLWASQLPYRRLRQRSKQNAISQAWRKTAVQDLFVGVEILFAWRALVLTGVKQQTAEKVHNQLRSALRSRISFAASRSAATFRKTLLLRTMSVWYFSVQVTMYITEQNSRQIRTATRDRCYIIKLRNYMLELRCLHWWWVYVPRRPPYYFAAELVHKDSFRDVPPLQVRVVPGPSRWDAPDGNGANDREMTLLLRPSSAPTSRPARPKANKHQPSGDSSGSGDAATSYEPQQGSKSAGVETLTASLVVSPRECKVDMWSGGPSIAIDRYMLAHSAAVSEGSYRELLERNRREIKARAAGVADEQATDVRPRWGFWTG